MTDNRKHTPGPWHSTGNMIVATIDTWPISIGQFDLEADAALAARCQSACDEAGIVEPGALAELLDSVRAALQLAPFGASQVGRECEGRMRAALRAVRGEE